jgi:hypothetical protein
VTKFRQRNQEKGLNFGSMIGLSTMTLLKQFLAQKSISEIDHPTLFS